MLTREQLIYFNPEYGAGSLKKQSQIKLFNSHMEAFDLIDTLNAEIDRLIAERKTHLDIIEQLKSELGFKDLAMNMVIIENELAKKPQGNTTDNLLLMKSEEGSVKG